MKGMKRTIAALALCAVAGLCAHANGLFMAAQNNNVAEVTRLIQAGEDVNARDSIGYTALMWAANHYAVDAAKALIEAGADTNETDNDGKTALMLAEERGSVDVIGFLKTPAEYRKARPPRKDVWIP